MVVITTGAVSTCSFLIKAGNTAENLGRYIVLRYFDSVVITKVGFTLCAMLSLYYKCVFLNTT